MREKFHVPKISSLVILTICLKQCLWLVLQLFREVRIMKSLDHPNIGEPSHFINIWGTFVSKFYFSCYLYSFVYLYCDFYSCKKTGLCWKFNYQKSTQKAVTYNMCSNYVTCFGKRRQKTEMIKHKMPFKCKIPFKCKVLICRFLHISLN